VLAFMLLCGYPPFWGDTELEVARSILNERVVLDDEDWAHVSDKGKAMVLGLLERNPSKRLGVDDVLKHTWLFAAKQTRSAKARKSFRTTVAKRRIRKMSMGPFEKSSKRMDAIYRHQLKQQKQNHVRQQRELAQQQKQQVRNEQQQRNERMAQLEAATKQQLAQLSVSAQANHEEHAKLQMKLANAQMTQNPLAQMGAMQSMSKSSSQISNLSTSHGSEDSVSAVSPLSLASARSDSYSYSNASASRHSHSSMSRTSVGRESVSFSANDWRRCSRTDDDLFELRLPSNINCTPRGSYADLNPFGDDDDDEDDVGMSGSYSHSSGRRRKYSQ